MATAAAATAQATCYHCGAPCDQGLLERDSKTFCCEGCFAVYELLQRNELCTFYQLDEHAGQKPAGVQAFQALDVPEISRRYHTRIAGGEAVATFFLPQIHCASCIWLLERLGRLVPGVKSSRVSLLERRIAITYEPRRVSLSRLAAVLAQLGYPPQLTHSDTEQQENRRQNRRLIMQIGVAGFCFGNIMMLSFPEYLASADHVDDILRRFFGWLSLLLALPVFFYSAADYFRNSWQSAKARYFSIDVPIALGLTAMLLRSGFDVISGAGPGYLDSMTGLVFFLLVGRYAQARTYQALSFERNYLSFLPLAVARLEQDREVITPISRLRAGDELLLRNGELLVADAELLSAWAQMDYSFISGESLPVLRQQGARLSAGGRVVGEAIRVRLLQAVQPGHLADLWNERRGRDGTVSLSRLADRIAKYFTLVVLGIALATFLFWMREDISKALLATTSVLIIACPCALAITVPFTLGNIMRRAGRQQIYLRQAIVVEDVAAVDTVAFDKTGTLTQGLSGRVQWEGQPLTEFQEQLIRSVALQSLHPLSRAVAAALTVRPFLAITDFKENAGQGASGRIGGVAVKLGSAAFVGLAEQPKTEGASRVFVSLDDNILGFFTIRNNVREGVEHMLASFDRRLNLCLLSGDQPQDRLWLRKWFGNGACMKFDMLPEEKTDYINRLQTQGREVMMVGDGLNDAGALQASRVGVAVADNLHQFTPGCDVLMHAAALRRLPEFIRFSRAGRRIILFTFYFSLAYNLVGMGLAVQAMLSPLLAAVLMPLSSLSVMVLSAAACWWQARRLGWST